MKHLETTIMGKSWVDRDVTCENMRVYFIDGLVVVYCKENKCPNEKKAREIGCLKSKP